MAGTGTREDPWELTTANGGSAYQMWRDEDADPPALVCQVGSTKLSYHLRAIDDLHTWLKAQDDWVPLGGADEQKAAPEGTVEAWGRSEDNPVGGWYGTARATAAGSAVPPAAAGGARPRRAGAQPEEQPGPGEVTPPAGAGLHVALGRESSQAALSRTGHPVRR